MRMCLEAGAARGLVLVVVLACAVPGENTVFWASPIALATRLFALLLAPLGRGPCSWLEAFAPLLEAAHATDLLYLQIEQGSFRTASFVLVFWLVLAVLECVRPRFWCRYLCPAGARLAPFRIGRGAHCTGCGQCASACPAGLEASSVSGNRAMACECLTCLSCIQACEYGALRYAPQPGFSKGVQAAPPVLRAGPFIPVRAPGSLPEPDVLACCLRCGLCMQALQAPFPLPLIRGVGPVCPTHAILPCLFPRRDGPGWA